MLRRVPLRSDPATTAEWQRRSRCNPPARRCEIRRTSSKRRRHMADRRAAVVPEGPREPVAKGPDHAFRKWITRLTCAALLGEETTRVDPAHHRTVAAHGDWIADVETGELRGNILPLSRLEHEAQHRMGVKTYAASRGFDLEDICRVIGEAYRAGWNPVELSFAARRAGGYQHVNLDSTTSAGPA